ncbi:hypothetical protein J437_LFUL001259 [Ladona fulva]|uniref:Uncharacterized protein n=1 Tax=Ladona fulva TaxID=123851 RepID=A0A8K0NU82_LADFU|nr:hypothetical protein J437_LFUL001259 [Ladona fulva]
MWGREIDVCMNPIPRGINPLEWYGEAFNFLLSTLKEGLSGYTCGGIRMTFILVVKNSDNLCIPSAICLGISRHEDEMNEFRRLYQSKSLLRVRALALCRRANIVIGEEGAGVEEIVMFQRVIPDNHITHHRFC